MTTIVVHWADFAAGIGVAAGLFFVFMLGFGAGNSHGGG